MPKKNFERQNALKSIMGETLTSAIDSNESSVSELAIDLLEPNPFQPRRYFDPSEQAKLVLSIKEHGILQPLLVRTITGKSKYQIIAGERRFRASQEAGLKQVPVFIKELSDHEALLFSIVENLQREELNPVDETDSILKLLSLKFAINVEEVVAVIRDLYAIHRGRLSDDGEDGEVLALRQGIAASLASLGFTPAGFHTGRLPILSFPADLLTLVRTGDLAYSVARVLSALKDESMRKMLTKRVLEENLSRKDLVGLINAEKPQAMLSTAQVLMKDLNKRFVKAKVSPSKMKKVESLLREINKLLDADNPA